MGLGGQQTCKRWVSRERMCNAVQCCLNQSTKTTDTIVLSVPYKVQYPTSRNRHHHLEPEAIIDSSTIKIIASAAANSNSNNHLHLAYNTKKVLQCCH